MTNVSKLRFCNRQNIAKCTVVFLISVFSLAGSYAQDFNFTMFDNSPMLLNPANTGDFYGDWRVALNYKNQWGATSSPYKTIAAGGDAVVNVFNQKIGVGAYILHDNSGAIRLVKNRVMLSAAYGYEIDKNYLRAGLQLGFGQSSFESWNLFNRETGVKDRPSGEDVGSSFYPDINFGLSWKRKIGIFQPEAGLALQHLTNPNESFLNNTSQKGIRVALHAKSKTEINDEIYVLPSLMFATQKGTSVSIIGANVGCQLLGNRSSVKQVFGGLYLRNGLLSDFDGIAAQIGTTVGRLDIALSYDMNMSGLSQTAGNMGGFEISLVYRSISTVLNSYSIPCERY